jgi:DNA-binding protein
MANSDTLVIIGKRDTWNLVDHCVTSYLQLCDKLGVKVQGRTVAEVRKELCQVKLVNANIGTDELVSRIESEVSNAKVQV